MQECCRYYKNVSEFELTNKIFTYKRLWRTFKAQNCRWCLIPPLTICSLLNNIKEFTTYIYYITTTFNLTASFSGVEVKSWLDSILKENCLA